MQKKWRTAVTENRRLGLNESGSVVRLNSRGFAKALKITNTSGAMLSPALLNRIMKDGRAGGFVRIPIKNLSGKIVGYRITASSERGRLLHKKFINP